MTLTAHKELETNVVTPTIRSASRKGLYWAIALVALLALAIISLSFSGAAVQSRPPLSPEGAGPTGSKALAEVLRDHGVTVTAADSMRQTRDAAAGPSDTTIFVVDDGGYLNAKALRELTELSSHVIIMTPTFDQIDTIAPQVALAGNVDGVVDADCALGPVQRAESVTGDGKGFRVIDASTDAVECFDSGDDVHSIVQVRHGSSTVTVVGTRDAFANEFVSREGNAALALGLLGETPHLVWLLPTIDEAPAPEFATIADLTPVWVGTVMTLIILAAIAAGFWRARRFGPLVVEALPVVVRASETMRGRARLYQKAADYLHTLDALRMGTIDRLSVMCGLPTVATVDEVIRAVAATTRRQSDDIALILRDARPTSEADLIRFSDSLLKLEAATAIATRPSSATMDSRATTTKPEENPQ